MTKKSKAKSPSKLAKTGKSGVALTETQLGQATGGMVNLKVKL